MTNQGQRRRRMDQRIPQRVEQAAQSMADASSGPRRGYIPPDTGRIQEARNPGMNYPNGQQAAAPNQGMNYGNGQQPAGNGYYAGQNMQQGGWYGQENLNGARRGYVMPNGQVTLQKPKQKKRHTGIAVAAVLLLLAALGTGGYFAAKSYLHTKEINDKIEPYESLFCPGVYVDGIHLGGMTPEQAMNSVRSQIQQRHDAWKVQLTYNNEKIAEINADMLEFSVDPTHVMNLAWQQGHTGDAEQRYADMIRLETEPYVAYTAQPDGNTQAIDTKLAEIKAAIDMPVTDAQMVSFDPSMSYPFEITDESYGASLDTEPVKEKLYQMVSTMESGTVELVPDRVEPAVRKADLIKHYMLRSSVYTPIDKHSKENRNNNIRRAFEFINGYILEPGKTFSFNNVVGERTEERGFFAATEYVYGEHVEGYGGGVCQASTTLYQAAVCAGLQILKREPHSDSVSYTDYGKDATVYWYGKRRIDLSFKNNTDGPIYIIAAVQEDPSNKNRLIAKVTIYGEDMGDVRYELESEIVETLPAPFNPVYVKDTNGTYVTYKDQQESVTKAKEGYVVESYLVEYRGNSRMGRTKLYTDTYEPKAERIYVGVKDRD